MAEQKTEQKFPTETIDLPTKGKIYGPNSPLSSGKVELKYMTAKEEDMLTSQNLIKKGTVIDKVINSLVVTEGVHTDEMTIGDKNALMIAARILAYGPEYNVEVISPETGEKHKHVFDLTEVKFKELPEDVDYSENEFPIELPITKTKIVFKLLTGTDEKSISQQLESYKKIGKNAEITTRLKHLIVSVNDDDSRATINNFVDNMLSKESLFLRDEVGRINPDINMTQEVELGGDVVTVDIPMTTEFFWPKTGA
jgi:hypothetical protein